MTSYFLGLLFLRSKMVRCLGWYVKSVRARNIKHMWLNLFCCLFFCIKRIFHLVYWHKGLRTIDKQHMHASRKLTKNHKFWKVPQWKWMKMYSDEVVHCWQRHYTRINAHYSSYYIGRCTLFRVFIISTICCIIILTFDNGIIIYTRSDQKITDCSGQERHLVMDYVIGGNIH